jgi:integrase/recombinase XerD
MASTARSQKVKALPVYPTLSEVHRILAACEIERDRMLIELLWHTGGRISEVLSIRVGDITTHGIKMVNLKQSIPSQKHVFLDQEFLERLRIYSAGRRPEEILVGRLVDNQQMTRQRAWQIVTGLGQKAAIMKSKFRTDRLRAPWPHSYRHGNAVQLLECGLPANAVQAQLGHSSLASTQVYTQLTDPHRRRLISGVKF